MTLQQNTFNTSDLKFLIQKIKEKYIPDERLDVFDIHIIENKGKLTLTGKTTNREAYQKLIDEAKELSSNIEETIQTLPNKNLMDKPWGVVRNSVADLRATPAHPSELTTQVLLGMPVKILDKSEDWLQVKSSDGYIGWITLGSLQLLSNKEFNNYLKKPKVIVTSHYGVSRTDVCSSSEPASDIVVGNILIIEDSLSDHYRVAYPDKRVTYISKEDAMTFEDWLQGIEYSGKSMVSTAKQFMGVPYVWGGTSSKGLDCSGFVKLVYFMHGIITARDASQQIKYGTEVDNKGNFDILQKGDLLFFGEKSNDEKPRERIVHVGIYMGNKEFIHASDNVHISSFDPNSNLYDEFNTNRYIRSMRYTGFEGKAGVETISSHPFYLPTNNYNY